VGFTNTYPTSVYCGATPPGQVSPPAVTSIHTPRQRAGKDPISPSFRSITHVLTSNQTFPSPSPTLVSLVSSSRLHQRSWSTHRCTNRCICTPPLCLLLISCMFWCQLLGRTGFCSSICHIGGWPISRGRHSLPGRIYGW